MTAPHRLFRAHVWPQGLRNADDATMHKSPAGGYITLDDLPLLVSINPVLWD